MSQVISSPYGNFKVRAAENAPPAHLMRFFGTGATNSGKSHFVSSIGKRCLVIDFEDKHRYIDFPDRAPYYVPASLSELDGLIQAMLADGPKTTRPYDMVVFDTADEMIPFVIDGMTKMMKDNGLTLPAYGDATDYGSGGGKGSKGWKLVNDRFSSYLRRLTMAGYGWGLVSHLKEETVSLIEAGRQVERSRLVPMLNPGILRPVQSLSIVKFQTFVRRVSTPTSKDLILPGGKTIKTSGEPIVSDQFAITFDSKEQGAVGLGGNLPLKGTFTLPKFNGWSEVMVPQYNQALSQRAKAPETPNNE